MLVESLSKLNLDIAACKQMKLSYISDIVMWSYYLIHDYAHNFFFFLKEPYSLAHQQFFGNTEHFSQWKHLFGPPVAK